MTVAELIKILESKEPNAIVTLRAIHGGADDLTDIKDVRLVQNRNRDWFQPDYQVRSDGVIGVYFN